MVEGLRLMAVGMFTVFAFLTLLVGLMHASAAFFEANAHRFPDADGSSADRKDNGRDEEVAIVLAVIEAARRGQKA